MDHDVEKFFKRVAERQDREQRGAPVPDVRLIADAEVVEDADVLEYDGVVPGTVAPPKTSDREHWRFADNIEHSDERMESHLQEVFEHRLGELRPSAGSQPPAFVHEESEDHGIRKAATGTAADIVKLLRSPTSIASAVVLSEILNRPVDRW